MPYDRRLEVRFRHRLGTLGLDVDFRTSAPRTVLFGPSGSGKSTILRAIAGVLKPQQGRIVIDGQVVFDSARRIWIPPHERPMRWAPQRAMLLPWKTVRGQMPLGMSVRDRQLSGPGWTDAMENVIDEFNLRNVADLEPHQLSGGQRQLVGVVRAAAGLRGRLLLLDEPFTGLDAAIRDRLIDDVHTWIGSSRVLSVTHDIEEAFLLKAEVVRIADGQIEAQGRAEDILSQERQRVLRNLEAGITNARRADSQ